MPIDINVGDKVRFIDESLDYLATFEGVVTAKHLDGTYRMGSGYFDPKHYKIEVIERAPKKKLDLKPGMRFMTSTGETLSLVQIFLSSGPVLGWKWDNGPDNHQSHFPDSVFVLEGRNQQRRRELEYEIGFLLIEENDK